MVTLPKTALEGIWIRRLEDKTAFQPDFSTFSEVEIRLGTTAFTGLVVVLRNKYGRGTEWHGCRVTIQFKGAPSLVQIVPNADGLAFVPFADPRFF